MSDEPLIFKRRDEQRDLLNTAKRFTYKELGASGGLDLHVFSPSEAKAGESELPAIVFFYGGGFWERGEIAQFGPHALHFVSRGIVAILADYRLCSSHVGATPMDSLEDVREGVEWICAHAGELGIDQTKLVLSGASTGAHAALAAVMDPDGKLKAKPAACVLFSPIVNLVREKVIDMFPDKRIAKLASPLHQVRKKLPPMMVFHGNDDRVQGVGDVVNFVKKMERKKNICELYTYEGERSSFFNFNVNHVLYEATLNAADNFLVRAGLLEVSTDGAQTSRLDSWR